MTTTDKLTRETYTSMIDIDLIRKDIITVDVNVEVSEECLVRKSNIATKTATTETNDLSLGADVLVLNDIATQSCYMNKDEETNIVIIMTRDSYTCNADRKTEMKEENVKECSNCQRQIKST